MRRAESRTPVEVQLFQPYGGTSTLASASIYRAEEAEGTCMRVASRYLLSSYPPAGVSRVNPLLTKHHQRLLPSLPLPEPPPGQKSCLRADTVSPS